MSSYVRETTLEKMIQKQVKTWESSKIVLIEKPEETRPFVTISREYGCMATPIAAAIAERLNRAEGSDAWQAYDKGLINKIVENTGVSETLIETIDTKKREEMNELLRTMMTDYPPQVTVYKKLVRTIRGISIHGRAIVVGRAGVVITRDLKYGLHLQFVAPLSYRIHKIMEVRGIKDKLEAERLVETKDRERHDFLTQYVKFESTSPASYDLTINIARFTDAEIAETVEGLLRAKKFIK